MICQAGLSAEELDRLQNTYQQRPRRKAFDLLGVPSTGQKIVLLATPELASPRWCATLPYRSPTHPPCQSARRLLVTFPCSSN